MVFDIHPNLPRTTALTLLENGKNSTGLRLRHHLGVHIMSPVSKSGNFHAGFEQLRLEYDVPSAP